MAIGRWLLAGFLVLCVGVAFARDDGRYAQSPLKGWFDSLRNQNNHSCCSDADGRRLDDPEWERTESGYRVMLKGEWRQVPPHAVLTTPNRVGYPIVWSWINGNDLIIVCFLPGAET